jgi:hypothetical protein
VTFEQIRAKLGEPALTETTEEEYGWSAYTWRKSGYRVTAQVWIRDYEEKGQRYPKGSIKWLEVSNAVE